MVPGQFLHAYLTTALWSSTDNSTPQGGEPLDKNYGIGDIAQESMDQAEKDCKKFLEENFSMIPINRWGDAGHDFWLTRNRHGAGFWDGDWPEEHGKLLTESAHSFGEIDPYIGEDGKIYFE